MAKKCNECVVCLVVVVFGYEYISSILFQVIRSSYRQLTPEEEILEEKVGKIIVDEC